MSQFPKGTVAAQPLRQYESARNLRFLSPSNSVPAVLSLPALYI